MASRASYIPKPSEKLGAAIAHELKQRVDGRRVEKSRLESGCRPQSTPT
jgi:hypothetical protein